MADSFKNIKIHAGQLLSILPTESIQNVADNLNVDYRMRKLTGVNLLRGMLMALFVSDEMSQRKVCATEASKITKSLFAEEMGISCSHSSLAERLKGINPDFFSQSYDLLYRQACSLYTPQELQRDNFIRVDSTMVSESSKKLVKAMTAGKKPKSDTARKGMFKASLAFDGFGVLNTSVFTDNRYHSEDIALPESLESALRHVDKNPDLFTADQMVALVDRGVTSLDNFKKLNDCVHFVGRLRLNRSMEVIDDRLEGKPVIDIGDMVIYSDMLVHLKGKKKGFDSTVFRVIKARYKEGRLPRQHSSRSARVVKKQDSEIWLITNIDDVDPDFIFSYYQKRWDIEVFYRFLKQNLSLKHIISTSENGIKVMIYLILIAALLLMIYKRLNDLGWNMGKYMFRLELLSLDPEELIAAKLYHNNISSESAKTQPPNTFGKV